MTSPVGLVIVSHSRKLAEGVVELAAQMAPGVPLEAAGGMPDGGIGTDYAAVSEAVTRADGGAGVVLLFDLGSAQMTADMVVETLEDPAKAVVAQAPLVEGAVAAAVAAAGGADLAAVAAAAEGGEAPEAAAVPAGRSAEAEIVLANDVGLHARPAALLARSLTGLSADVTVRFGDKHADGRSVLALLGLTARKGDRLLITARGDQADEAVARIKKLADENFAE
ncbi:MAG TPA: dihydroxyacetone kinase phosphoryl donor subunit DhaM [Pseudonocardiaceae bacterium]|nr:dihydroxyacetone kinase phosphoryl donor subunit DhaM [Pseudonocardiaceae bacterium]